MDISQNVKDIMDRQNVEQGSVEESQCEQAANEDHQQRSLQFFGHLVRRNNIHRVLIEGKINGKRGRERPTRSWVNNIVKWTGLDYPSVVRTAQDRHRWKAVSSDPLTVDGT